MFFVQAAVDQGATKADWLEAWATVAAAVGTIGAFVWQARALSQERRTRRAEIARLQAEQREAQDAQARTIVLHRESCTQSWDSPNVEPGPKTIVSYSVRLGNYGEHPITNVVAGLIYRPTRELVRGGEQRPLPRAVFFEEAWLSWHFEELSLPWPEGEPEESEKVPELFRCEVQFTDVHGTRWAVRPGLGQQPSRVYDRD